MQPPTLSLGPLHHAALTVSDIERATHFYTNVLGLQLVATFGPKRIFSNGHVMLGIGEATSADPATTQFDERRVGMDHISFGVPSRQELERACQILDAHGVSRGEITDLADFGISILAFRDPDNIQLELTAPLA
jgi:catechol 2,3-dioxygenase-like lactoylglutathione lyase family enzyme